MQTIEERKAYKRKYYAEHRIQRRAYSVTWRAANVDRERERQRRWRLEHAEELRSDRVAHREEHCAYQVTLRVEARAKVLAHYGAKCQCCGETEEAFLSIDHINGGGFKHRKELGGGSAIYAWLIKNNFPEGFQVLCYNCNQAKGHRGECPHKKLIPNPDYIQAWKEGRNVIHFRPRSF